MDVVFQISNKKQENVLKHVFNNQAVDKSKINLERVNENAEGLKQSIISR